LFIYDQVNTAKLYFCNGYAAHCILGDFSYIERCKFAFCSDSYIIVDICYDASDEVLSRPGIFQTKRGTVKPVLHRVSKWHPFYFLSNCQK